MKTWYCVTTAFDNSGRVMSAITDAKQAESQPESSYTSTAQKDVYCDWFGSMRDAQKHVKEAQLT